MAKQKMNNPDVTAAASPSKPTVVGIGASAGGLGALKRLFQLFPADCGLVFVVVVHLSPEHKSHLADLLQPNTKFPVRQVTETTSLEPNNVYVIPPNANLSAIDTHLRLTKLEENRRQRAPIDHFFRTLASTHDGHAIGVILTGTGSDGTLGLREIKAKGGVILVQDPNEAEFDGMPQSAIATGLVDRILPLAEIPDVLLRLASMEPKLKGAAEDVEPTQAERVLLPKILAILKTRTDRDFSRYKPATLLRRIARRMQLNYLDDFEVYLDRLREQPDEARALADDLLINVTSFFRDPEVFQKLQTDAIPHLFAGKSTGDTLRVWSVGCATGEEAYSLAMMLLEEAARHEAPPRIQIFASDLHKRSLDSAREGLYPGDIQTDVSPERLKRFFQKENGGYRICKEVRDLVVFAPHNLLGDPPFSRLDLIACRNLLIYLERGVQGDVIELFHYALCPNGYLLLGSAETIDLPELFRTEDKKLCVYRKRNVPAPEPRLPVFPLTRFRVGTEPSSRSEFAPASLPFQALHQNLLERFAPPSILIGPDNRLVHTSEHAGRYLMVPGGETTLSALRLVREELRIELSSLLQAARDGKDVLDSRPIPVRFNGHSAPVVMHVRPALDADQEGFVLVIFEEHQAQTAAGTKTSPADSTDESGQLAQRVRELESELITARQRLQATIEEYETSREEMKASHEEMQSTNEELRSTMEELETSKEELQSINEELQTVNQENRHKVEELSQLSGDLQNLLASTDIATLFLDREFRIMRFTPRLADLFNVRITDRGRPISDLTHRLGYSQLHDDARLVLERLVPVEREIHDDAGRWYLTRVLPYRSTDDRIEGVVITFVEMTERKRIEAALRQSEVLRSVALTGGRMGTWRWNLNSQLIWGDAQFWSIWGTTPSDDPRPLSFFNERMSPESRSAVAAVVPDAVEGGEEFEGPLEVVSGPTAGHWLQWRGRAGTDDKFMVYGVTFDITEQKRVEEALAASEEKYRTIFDSIDEGFCVVEVILDDNGKPFDLLHLEANDAYERHTGLTGVVGRRAREFVPEGGPWLDFYGNVALTGQPARNESFLAGPINRWVAAYASRIGDEGSLRVAVVFNDVTERKRVEEALRESEERQTFLLRLSDALRPLMDGAEIQQETTRLLGEHLHLDRCYYFETDYRTGEYIIHRDFKRGDLRSLVGRHAIQQWPEMTAALSSGEMLVVHDYANSPDIPPAERAPTENLDIRAIILIPLVKHGTLVACMAAIQAEPRQWTSEEVTLVADVAERTWAAVERARSEAALREIEENQRRLLEGIPQLVWQSKDHGYWTWTSPQWQAFTGQSQEESHGRGWLNALHPDDVQGALESWTEAEKKGVMEVDYRIREQRTGGYRYHHTRSTPIRNEKGLVVEWLGTCTDIEDLKQAEAERQNLEEQFRLFVDNVQEYGLVQTDADGLITNWNPGAERLFGFAPAEVVGRDFTVLMTEEDQQGGIFPQELAYVREGNRNEDARWFVRKDGSRFWARWMTEPIHDANGAFVGLAKIMRDETERERAAATTKSALAEKEELLKEVHHRVKNNLQVITSLLNLQAAQIEDGQTLVVFDEARNRVAAIASIHELLYRSANFSAVHLADYAHAFAPNLLEFYGAQGRVDVSVLGDGVTLELERAVPYGLLLNELLSNALKHAFPNGRKGHITISLGETEGLGLLTVADDGVGLPVGLEIENATTLGLKLVRNLARQLRGQVEIRNAEQGAVAEVQFPITHS